MRTFHIGGIASAGREDPVIHVRKAGKLKFVGLRLVTLANGQQVTLNKTGSIQVLDRDDRIIDDYPTPAGALLHFKDGDDVDEDTLLAQWDPYNIPILSEKKGVIAFEDMLPGVTTKIERDASGGRSMVVIEHKEDLNPQIIVKDSKGDALATYSVPTGAQVAVDDGTRIDAGSIIAKTPRQASKTQDITGGLPRVAELFEARRPKEGNVGQMAKIDGIVSEAGTLRSKKRLLVTNEDSGQVEEHLIPHGKHVLVQPGDFAQKGQLITEGAKDPHEILEILGPSAVQEYLIEEIQKVYRLQGVTISDKHLEIIISRMLMKVRITDPGDTEFFWGDQVDRYAFMDANETIGAKGGMPAEGEPILLGITKASLETDSFISAASFQETTRVLTNAATLGKVDELNGFKENVIMGHLIPAGTGLPKWRRLKIDTLGASASESLTA
jgi:DNA-directed RNA polymerase subunit beta'